MARAGDGLLLGIDGGNTKSIALVARPDGAVVGAGRSEGTSDLHAVPLDEAFGRLEAAADAAIAAALAPGAAVRAAARGGIAGAGLSLAGADWPEDFAAVQERLAGRWPALAVVNDGVGALRAAIPEGPGVVVVCGTGAATGARGPDGRLWHSSFWQLTQGAHELGAAGLEAIVRAELGIAPPTALTAAILGALAEPTVEAVLHRITGRATRSRREQAAIAPVVLDAAEAGDDVALSIVRTHGASLGRYAVVAARQVGIRSGRLRLALSGGVLRHDGSVLRDALVEEVRVVFPEVEIVLSTLEPAAGALLLAFDAAGIPVGPEIDRRLRETMPATDLFDTRLPLAR